MATLEDLKGFATVGNIYVDSTYTAEATPATDPITGEALEFGVNAFDSLPGGTASAVPANGSALFITNVDLGTSKLYNGRPEKTTLYDVYVSNVKSGDIYVMPRAAGDYTPDTGTLNVYVEDVTIASGGYHGFGATEGANFSGNYDVTIKNSTMQYLAVATGSAYGVDNGTAANHRFALINGDVNFTLSNLTVTSVAGVARGSIGSADEKAKVVGLVENSIFGNNFHILFNGVDSSGNTFNSWNDVDITISGSSFSGAFMMYPNQSSATREVNGELTIHGDVKLKVSGSTMNGLVIGAGRSGTGWQRTGWVDGNFDFEISGSTTGVSFINKGSLGKAETPRTVVGKINNGSVVGNFVAYELRSDKASAVYADSAITITDATIGKFTFLTGLNGSGGATVGVSDRLYGTQTLELTGSTAGDILSVAEGASQADATFDLSFHASETKSAVGAIGYWNTLTVDAGASVQAASIGNVSLVTLAQGANLSVGTFSDVDVLNVLGEYTAVSNTLVSGLTSFSAGSDIKSVQLNGVELEYGFMPGQYSLVGDKLVLHQGETVLVNSTFPGGGADVTYNEQVFKGYTTVAEAQASFTADKYLITVVPVDGGTIDADIVTKNYGVIVQGTSDSPISMEGYDFIIGDLTTKYDGATIIIENLSSVGTIAFGDLDALFVSGNGVEAETVDLRGGAIGDAEISFSNLTAKDVYLPSAKSMDGKLEIVSGQIENIYNSPEGDGKLAVSLGKDTSVEKLYAEGKAISVGDATVGEYYAGLKDGGEVASIDFTASGNINTLVLGGEAKNTIGSVNAKFTGSGIQTVTVGGENDEITGNVDVELNGPVGVSNDNPFNGIKYGATLSAIDGGTDKVAGKATLNVTGHSKVDAITGFDAINVTGGTLNLTGSGIEGTADIVNRRTISAKEGAISAGSIDNTGVIAATNVTAAGAFTNAGEFRVDEITVGGTFDNSSVIYVTGSITVNGVFTNSGDIYASSGDNAAITLNGVDLVNTGTIYTGSLNGVNNITTSSLFVKGAASIDGGLTIDADSIVAFQGGLDFNGIVKIDATSTLSVGGDSFDGTSITIDVGDMVGFNEVVRANGGLESWTVNLSGANAGDYSFTRTATSIVVYSSDEVFVNSKFSADSVCSVDGVQLLYGANAFSSVEDAVKAAKAGAKITIVGDKTGMDVVAAGFDVVLDDSVVGDVTAKTVSVSSDSTVKNIVSASKLTVDAGAVLTVTETIPAALPIEIDATEGSGSRLVLDVDSTKVTLDPALVTILAPAGKEYAKQILGGESAHAGDLYLVSTDVVYYAPIKYEEILAQGDQIFEKDEDGNLVLDPETNQPIPVLDDQGNPTYEVVHTGTYAPTFVDGDFDKATGDALFNNVNIFQVKDSAVAVATDVSGVLVIVDHMDKNQYVIPGVTTAFECDMEGVGTVNSSLYGGVTKDERFTATGDTTVMVLGTTMRGNLYSIAKTATIGSDYTYTLVIKDSVQTQASNSSHGTYFVSRDNGSQIDGKVYVVVRNSTFGGQPTTTVGGVSTINGDINYDISGSTFAAGLRLVTNNLGAQINGEVNADITGTSITDFYVAYGNVGKDEENPSDLNVNISNSRIANLRAFRLSEDANAPTTINANLNLTILDSVITDAFYAVYTGDWDGGNGVRLRYTNYNSGSITVTLGGVSVANQIHGGDSLTHSRNALLNFNIPTVLHIVKGESGARTTAAWVMEWETIIVDAGAEFYVNNDLQWMSGDVTGRIVNDGQPAMFKINLAGYEGGTKRVIRANSIYYKGQMEESAEIIGDDSTKAGRYELVFVRNNTTLQEICVFDKADTIYLNSGYTGNTTYGSQALYYGYNAQSDAEAASALVTEWGSELVVTGGTFEDVDFASVVTVTGGAVVDTLSGAGSDGDLSITIDASTSVGSVVAATNQVAGDLTVTVNGLGVVATDIDGVKDSVAGTAKLDVKADANLGDVTNFDEITIAKGAEVSFGELTNSGLVLTAENLIYADSVTIGDAVITIDVTGYEGGPRGLIVTADGITDYAASKVQIVGGTGFSVTYSDGTLSLLTTKPTDVYLNSSYSEATTGTLYDGVYLEFGFNAFNTFEAAAAKLGEGYSVIMTGGEFTDDITLDGISFVMKGGVLGSIAGGTGASSLTVEGNAVVTDGIEDLTSFTITADDTLVTDHLDMVDGGTITIKGGAFEAEFGNLHKVVDTVTGIVGIDINKIVVEDGVYAFYQNNDLFLLDKSHIYLDTTYTEAITGTTAANGDTLIYGVNAFNTDTAAYNALVVGGTLFVSNWGTAGTQAANIAPGKPASIVAQGPTNFSVIANGGTPQVVNDDITVIIDSANGTPQASSRLLGTGGGNNNRWVFNGNVVVTFKGSGNVNTNTDFGISSYAVFNGDLFQINIEGKSIDTDYWFIRNVQPNDFANLGKLELNITGVTTSNAAKWTGLFEGDPNLPTMHIVANITDSLYRAGNNDWSVGLVSTGDNGRNAIYDVHLNGSTIMGWISGARTSKWNGQPGGVYEGTRTLYVDGTKTSIVQEAMMFHHIIVDANAQLVVRAQAHFLAANSSGPNTVELDVSGYTGADKMLLSTPSFTGAEFELVLTGNTNDVYVAGLGMKHGAFIITKNGDVYYNTSFSDDDIGLAVGTSFVLIDGTTNTNAFTDYAEAKAAIDARTALGLDRSINVGGVGDGDAFYADGYKVNVYGGTYSGGVYGSAEDGSDVASVNMTISGGVFVNDLAVSDEAGKVTGDAVIELAGGTFGIPAVYETPDPTEDDPNPEPELVEDAIPVSINGSKDFVGGTSTLVVSADLTVTGEIKDFDVMLVNANLTVTDDVNVESITINASNILTVEGEVEATTIVIDATEYVGPSKVIAVSETFETLADQPAVSILGDLDVYDYKYVEDTLYLVSKHAGNVYLNSTWDESISGTIYNGELLVWGVNAVASMDDAVLKLTDDYTLYITGGNFNDTYTFSGKANIDIRDDATSIGGLVLGDGSTITISGTTSGSNSIGSIVAVEGYTTGININALSKTAFGTLSDVRSFTFSAAEGITVDGITYRENGGYLNVDFKGYTAGAANVLQTKDGINNFLQYNESIVIGGETVAVSRTVVGANNNDAKMMPYYDETKKAVIVAEPGAFAFLEADGNDADNGTVVTIDGQTTTKVYGYNLSNWNVNVGRYTITGGTLFADGGETGAFYWFFTGAPVNVNVTGITTGGFVAGYNDDSAADEKFRDGEFTAVINASTITWFACIAGQGSAAVRQEMVVGNLVPDDPEDPETGYHYEDTAWNVTISNGTHDTNDFRVARYANLSGGTVNVTISDYMLRGDLMLFDRIYNGQTEGVEDKQLKEVNVTLKNVQEPAAKWIQVWEPQEDNNTKIVLTITDMNMAGDNTSTIGLFGNDLGGTWTGEADVYISGLTNANGNLNGGRGVTDGGLNNIGGTRRLHVVGGTNNVATVREFNSVEIADGALLTGNRILMSEGEGFILRGETGYTGDAKFYAVAGTTISGATEARFLDADDNEIEGYAAVVGNTNVFIYKTTGDVFYNNQYTAQTTGTFVTESDGTRNILVFGDNAVAGMDAAAQAIDFRGDATLRVVSAASTNFETRGYTAVFEGGRATTIWGGYNGSGDEEKAAVDSADITVEKGATVTNINVAAEKAQVSGNAVVTIGDGAALAGNIDGAAEFVGGTSLLNFNGSATVDGSILGFDGVSVDADGLVVVGGAVSDVAITIDTADFKNSSKVIMTAEGAFADSVTVSVGAGFDYKFSDDRKSLLVVSPFVGDAFFNTTWDSSVSGLIVDGVELVWGKNAFNTMAAAVSAVGEGYSVIMDGGATTEDVNLNGHDFVAGGTQVGTLTSAGATLTVTNTLAATGLSGFASIDMTSGATLTVSGAVALAENATLSIDVTGYTMSADDEVVISAAGGITNLETKNITVTGSNNIAAYVSEEDGNVHLVKLSSNRYFSTAYSEEATQGVKDPTTGEILFFGKNAFNTLTPALNSTVTGGTVFIYDRNGQVNPSGTEPKNLYLIGGTVSALRNMSGDRSAVQVNVPISLTVDGTLLTGDMDYILGRGNTWTSVGETLSYFQPVTVTMTGGTNTGNIRFVGQWSSILGDITFNLKDWTLLGDIKPFSGDARHGSNDSGLSKIVWNWENVTLPDSKWIAIANVTDWGADKVGADGVTRQSMDAIEFNMKNVNLRGSNARIAAIVEGTGADRVDSNTDITFTVEDSFIDTLLTTTLTDNYTLSTFGVKTLNITGTSSYINWANWFQTLNIATADTFLSGGTITFEGSGVINVDATGYTGGSKVLVSLTSGFRQSDDSKPVELNLVQDGEAYELVYGSKALVLKSNVIDNVYVNSTYTTDITGATYAATGELLIFETNAFANMADALTVLPADGSIFVTGGSVEVATALPSNDLSIDVGANLTYKGTGAITITDTFVNEGTLTISTEGYEIVGDKTVALTAGTISGAGTYKVVGDDRYLISREGNTLYFIERDVNVFVNTAWKDLDAGTIVTLISGETATVGINAFATGDAALANVFGGGTITIEAGDVTFTNNVNCTVTALEGVTVDTLIVVDQGNLVASSGATVINATIRKGGMLTVDAGALVTGMLALGSGAAATVNGTFNFDLTGLTTAADARVNNIGLISGTPSYSITIGAGQEDGVYTLAGGAAGFAVTSAISVTTAAGDGTITALDQTVDIGGTLYTLSVTETGDLTLTKEIFVPAIEITYVDSNWTDKKDGDVVSVSGGTAIFGYDAFLTGDEAYAAVVDAGKVEVLGGTVSFTAAIEKTVVVNANATLTGAATFAKAITIDGTVAFDTAIATVADAQFEGFSFVSGNTKYTLTDAAATAGTYLLASDAATFSADVAFGAYTLKVGEDVIVNDTLVYTLGITDNNELALTIAEYVPPTPTTPTQTYANSEWAGKAAGEVVTVTGGTAVIGYDAFALLSDAIAGVTDDGKINVTGGEVSFADGYSKTITVDAGATVVGTATFDTAITVNGTFAFDTAIATAAAAQFGGFSKVAGSATYTLTDAAAAKGTYLLASDAATFDSDVQFGTYTLKVGEDVTVGDLVYTLGITDNSELALTIADKPVPPTPTEFVAKSDIDGNGVSDVMFVWTQTYDPTTGELVPGNYQHGYWMNGTSTWQSANATHPSNWDNLGNFDMTGDGKADSVLFGNVDAYEVPSAYIGYYKDGIDTDENWVTIGFLTNVAGIAWQNKVGNMTGNESGVNSIAWYAPELGSVGVWTDGTENWVQLNGAFMEGWTLAGIGDFDGDGKDTVVMSYNGGQFLYTVGIGDEAPTSLGSANWSGWELRAIGDFSGDGKDDIILFHQEFGAMAMLVDGNSDNYQSIGQLDAKDWFVVGCGDYNGDKMDDLLVRQYSTGMLGYYVSADQSQWVELGRGVDMQWTVIA